MDMLSENKDGAAAGANIAVICLAVCGGLYFCGKTIGEFNSNRSAMAVMKEKLKYGQKGDLKNETEQRLKDQLIADEKCKLIEEKLKNETLMTDLKLKLSEEKLKNAEERLKKGNLW